MTYDRLKFILVWLLIAAATLFLLDRLLGAVAALASPLLLFAVAWLFMLALKPLVDGLTRVELSLPRALVRGQQRGSKRVRFPHTAAVLLVYLGMLALIIGIFVLLVPVVIAQFVGLQATLPQMSTQLLFFIEATQRYINRLGLRADLTTILQPDALSAQVAALGSEVVKQSLTVASGIAALLFNLVFVLILSFYMMIDGERLLMQGIRLLPINWRGEVQALLLLIDRTFGGFLRSQLIQSLVYGLATAALMIALGVPDVALVSIIAGVCVLIPIIGGVLAVIPPVALAMINAPDQALWLLLGLLVIQQIVFNVIMPKLVGQIVGLPPLLVFAALLIGGTLAGGWGILFGIPIAGVLASVFLFLFQRSSLADAERVANVPTVAAEPEPPLADSFDEPAITRR
ncbi:MAG: AI-2E family transporter [Roseiflexaceae bacterium]|nr:AI-2E family transporter [Roseiflexaceae bacterium]